MNFIPPPPQLLFPLSYRGQNKLNFMPVGGGGGVDCGSETATWNVLTFADLISVILRFHLILRLCRYRYLTQTFRYSLPLSFALRYSSVPLANGMTPVFPFPESYGYLRLSACCTIPFHLRTSFYLTFSLLAIFSYATNALQYIFLCYLWKEFNVLLASKFLNSLRENRHDLLSP